MYKLWEYQQKIENEIDDFYKHGGHSILVQAPTGTGKSLVMMDYIKRMQDQRKPIYFVTHSKSLLWQFSAHLKEIDIPHGILAPGCPTLRYRVQVISAQSLHTRIKKLAEPWGVIFEEAHHSPASMFAKILEVWPNAKLLGLTATPCRQDGKPLKMYEKLITSPPVRWFIDEGYLSDYDYYIPAEFSTSGMHRKSGDFSEKELAAATEADKTRVKNLVEYYGKYAKGLQGIAFGTSIADSENIAEQFRAAGYNMKALHSEMKEPLQSVLDACQTGAQPLVSSCDIIGEGVDVKGLTAMIDGRATDSLVIQMQHWGRVLRALYADGYDLSTKAGRLAAIEAGGKGKAKILDFSSNYLRHGLPDDPREWTLNGKIKAAGEALYKRCPDCQRPVPSATRICPYCGYEFVGQADAAPAQVKEREGELVPLSSLSVDDKNGVALKIARQARSLKQAITVAEKYGVNHQAAWFIWRKLLKQRG